MPQGNSARPTAFEVEFGPAPLAEIYRRGIYVQVCARVWLACSNGWARGSWLFSASQHLPMRSVGGFARRPVECLDHPCPCLTVLSPLLYVCRGSCVCPCCGVVVMVECSSICVVS